MPVMTWKTKIPGAGPAVLFVLLFTAACSGVPAPPPAPDAPLSVEDAFEAVVGVYASIPETARTAQTLGARRQGSGVVLDGNGLVLTIGYLILEAEAVAVVGPEGSPIPADLVAYDHASGFGLVRARRPLDARPLKLGNARALRVGSRVLAVSHGGEDPVTAAAVVSRRPFAAAWEYLLENAIFTTPPHPRYGGAALIDGHGNLVGLGSLMVNDAVVQDRPVIGNLFVPVDILRPILTDLIRNGRRGTPPPPWLGLYTEEAEGRVYITRLAENGPARRAGLKARDIIIGVGGRRVGSIMEFLRRVRAQGPAGSPIGLDVLPFDADGLDIRRVEITSMDRYDWLLAAP